MIPIYLYLVGSSLLGLGFWLGRASGRSAERHDRDQIVDDVVRIRTGFVPIDAPLPVQYGTLPEHHRRLALTAGPHVAAKRPARTVSVYDYRKAQLLLLLDRVIGPLRTSTGRHRAEDMPALYGTVAQRRHSAARAQHDAHLAWSTSTGEWPTLALARGWTVPDIPPTIELGELVSSS